MDPCRERPLPFCGLGFLPPPRTSPRVFPLAVPALRLASCHSTTRWRISVRIGAYFFAKILFFECVLQKFGFLSLCFAKFVFVLAFQKNVGTWKIVLFTNVESTGS